MPFLRKKLCEENKIKGESNGVGCGGPSGRAELRSEAACGRTPPPRLPNNIVIIFNKKTSLPSGELRLW